MMERVAESDPAKSVDGPEGTVRWAPNDAYAQAHGNKSEYAGRVRDVGKNILLVWGNIHSYYPLSQARSQNAPLSAVISKMIEKALQVKAEQQKQEMEERLAQQRDEMREEHKQQMKAMNTVITKQFAAQMAAYEARFRSLELSTLVSSEPEVTTKRVVPDLGSPARHIVRSSANSTQGNNQVIFYYHLIRQSSGVNKYHDNE